MTLPKRIGRALAVLGLLAALTLGWGTTAFAHEVPPNGGEQGCVHDDGDHDPDAIAANAPSNECGAGGTR